MRAELMLMGKRLDMAPRVHRRQLVVLIYAVLVAAMIGFWFLDRWHTSAPYLLFATIIINRVFLGGFSFGGLIKPFSGKPPRRSEAPPPFLLLALRVYQPEPDESQYRNDEREIEQRNRAVYKAYQSLMFALIFLWLLMNFHTHIPRLLERLSIPIDSLLYGLATAAIILALTLPQAILLWTEPDMEEDPAE
jgi:hypothetical protein